MERRVGFDLGRAIGSEGRTSLACRLVRFDVGVSMTMRYTVRDDDSGRRRRVEVGMQGPRILSVVADAGRGQSVDGFADEGIEEDTWVS